MASLASESWSSTCILEWWECMVARALESGGELFVLAH
jgi:hypothetical protein